MNTCETAIRCWAWSWLVFFGGSSALGHKINRHRKSALTGIDIKVFVDTRGSKSHSVSWEHDPNSLSYAEPTHTCVYQALVDSELSVSILWLWQGTQYQLPLTGTNDGCADAAHEAGEGGAEGRVLRVLRSRGHFTRLESERDFSVGVREGPARGAAAAHARAPRPTPRAATLATYTWEYTSRDCWARGTWT